MRISILILLLFLTVEQLTAQNIIKGKVDSGNEPIIGATVQIQGTEIGAVVDVSGRYLIEYSATGNVKLEVRAVGYKPQTRTISLSQNGVVTLNFELEESSLGLDEVVITGTMQPKFITDSPVKVEVITSDYLNTFTPAAASSIVEGIKLVNGIQEVTACGVCFTNSISINGLPGPYTAVLMDGTPIYGNLASVYGLNGIPSMIIDRFEVIKGPSSTLYGSEAVAGVINIITKDPAKQPKLSVDVMGTSHLESFGNLAGTIKGSSATGFIGLNYAYINDFDDENGDGFGDNINLDRYSLFTKWNMHRKSGKKFTIAGKYYYEDRRNGVEEYLANRNYKEIRGDNEIYGESIYTNRAEIFGTYHFPLSGNVRLDYSLSAHDQNSYYGADFYKAEQQIGFANLIWDKSLDNHNLLVGLTNRVQRYDDNTLATRDSSLVGIKNKPDNQFIPGIFVQDEWDMTDNFTLLLGGRLDHYNQHGAIFSPRVNFKYKLSEWTSVRTNLGTGFRIVNLFTEDHAFVTGQRTVEIEGELKPERSYNSSINLNHVYSLGDGQGMIDVDAYYTYFTNKIIPNYDDPSTIVYANTEGHAITKGLGFNINHDFFGPLAMSLGFNWQEVTQTEPNTDGTMITTPVEFAQEYSGVITVNYEIKKWGLSAGYTARITGPMALPEVYDLDDSGNPKAESRPTRSEPFSFHNIQLTKNFKGNWSIYTGVQNIFDYRQSISPLVGYNDPNASIGFSDSFDTSYAFAPIHGREVYLGVKWNLN